MLLPLRILYLEDHLILRQALRDLLERLGNYQIIAEAASATDGLKLLEEKSPELALVDVSLKDHDGIWFVREARARGYTLPIVMLTMHEDDQHVTEAFQAGANGYLVKSATQEEVAQALDQAAAGESYIHPRVAAGVVRYVKSSTREEPLLSKREREILASAASGLSNHEIAEHLFLSLSTVKTHLHSIYRKLQVRDRTQAILEAIHRQEIPPVKSGREN